MNTRTKFVTTKGFLETLRCDDFLDVGNAWLTMQDHAGREGDAMPLDRNGARELRDWLTAALNDDVEEPEEGDGVERDECGIAKDTTPWPDYRALGGKPLTTYGYDNPCLHFGPGIFYLGTDAALYRLDHNGEVPNKREHALASALIDTAMDNLAEGSRT